MDDQTPELDGASEEALELELEPVAIPPKEPSSDPLDEITDEVVRSEAKKHRAIARRLEKEPKQVVPVVTTPPVNEYLTKADFFKSNERKAIREITADAEIKASWNDIIPFYTPRRGKETPEDIKEDIQDAITLYKARHPDAPVKDDSINQLTATPVVKTGGGSVVKATHQLSDPPNFKLPAKPSEWYGKKS